MQYFITFLEGIITFISPCLLPMLPIYVSYFSAGGERRTKKTLTNALGFVTGFTLLFISLGALAGTAGAFLSKYQTAVNVISGLIVIFFGLQFMGAFKISLSGGRIKAKTENLSFFSSLLFGLIFSVSWTPCVSAFLGSALMLASQRGHMGEGILLLLLYSLGLGIPFVFSALLIDKLKGAFGFIKKHYNIINTVCGIFLIIVGILMATGLLGRFLALLSA
ncbi:MAG: cytochrome c biogenesis protein CcdA [Clostridia bacterium]|nr:cytochrome c biogenesis protein CcdA [Clostridia bacterium]